MLNLLMLALCFLSIEDVKNGEYDIALSKMNVISMVPKSLHHQYYFHKAVAEHQTLKRDEALESIKKFNDSFDEPPRRYQAIIWGLEDDLQSWEKGGLPDIARKMNEVKNRLKLGQAGDITQGKQKEIVKDLDRLIEELEAKNKPKGDGDGSADGSTKPGSGPSQGTPASDSHIMGTSGAGKINEQQLNKIAQQWGSLPPEKRAKIIEDINRDLPSKYKVLVDDYFKALNKIHK